eukprot:TRINITY_DN37314_c0_g1_i1.p1 TRINITY_DN37314_c0_g1~~TRINITY_DN37314_c0_g1_i1.p1  ORF type:complete len:402 (+),score=73.26 TRINITY_DN37314_c0_g1_i1:62-1267(+)
MNRAVLCSIAARGRRFNQVWMVKPHKLEVWRDKVNRRLKEDLTKPVTHRKREKEAREEKEGWPWNDGHMADHAAKLIRKEVLGYGVRKTHAKITELLVELKRLERLGCTMGPKTFNVLVKHAFGQHDLVTMKVLWEDIAARGLPVSQFVWGKILFFHVTMRDIGALKTAWKTYLRIDGNREALLGTYINALAKAGCREEAFSLFRGIVGPSKGNYHAVLPACSSYQEAKELIGEMENTVGTDLKTYTELIELLAKLKNPQMAQKVFDKVTKVIEPDSLCRDALLRAYADSADLPGLLSAIKIFEARSTTTSRTPIFIVTTCTACLDLPDPDVPYLRSLVHATYHNYRYKCKHKDQFRLIAFTHRFYHKLSPDEGTTFKRAAKLEMDNRDRHSYTKRTGYTL